MRSLFIKIIIRFVLITCVLLLSGVFSSAYALQITVKDHAIVYGNKICLKDIASFQPSDDNRIKDLEALEISASPAPGKTLNISKSLLIYKVAARIASEKDINLKVPNTLQVQRKANSVSSEEMKKIFIEYVKANSPWDPDILVFDRINTPNDLLIEEGGLEWEIDDRNNRDFIGNVSLIMNFTANGKPFRKCSLTGRVGATLEIIKSAKAIKSGDLLEKDDLMVEYETCFKIKKGTVTDVEDVIGKQSIRSMQPGKVITYEMIKQPPEIQKGEQVVILAESDEIKITTPGEVLEDGCSGDQIRVVNISSGKELSATVMGPGVVRVVF